MQEAPQDGKEYARKEGVWVESYSRDVLDQFLSEVLAARDQCNEIYQEISVINPTAQNLVIVNTATASIADDVSSVHIAPPAGYVPGQEYVATLTLPLLTDAKQVVFTINHKFGCVSSDGRLTTTIILQGAIDGTGHRQPVYCTSNGSGDETAVRLAYRTIYYAIFYDGAWNIADAEPYAP